jgi:hypothetical protein
MSKISKYRQGGNGGNRNEIGSVLLVTLLMLALILIVAAELGTTSFQLLSVESQDASARLEYRAKVLNQLEQKSWEQRPFEMRRQTAVVTEPLEVITLPFPPSFAQLSSSCLDVELLSTPRPISHQVCRLFDLSSSFFFDGHLSAAELNLPENSEPLYNVFQGSCSVGRLVQSKDQQVKLICLGDIAIDYFESTNVGIELYSLAGKIWILQGRGPLKAKAKSGIFVDSSLIEVDSKSAVKSYPHVLGVKF